MIEPCKMSDEQRHWIFANFYNGNGVDNSDQKTTLAHILYLESELNAARTLIQELFERTGGRSYNGSMGDRQVLIGKIVSFLAQHPEVPQ